MGVIDRQLFNACMEGDLQKVKKLIVKGANVNVKSSNGDTPLIMTAWKGYTDISQLLIDSGADTDMSGDLGDTPLILASWCGNVETVKLLLDNGADANVVDNEGHTAISYAFNIEDKDKKQELLEIFNHYCPEAFMSEYMDWSIESGR